MQNEFDQSGCYYSQYILYLPIDYNFIYNNRYTKYRNIDMSTLIYIRSKDIIYYILYVYFTLYTAQYIFIIRIYIIKSWEVSRVAFLQSPFRNKR